MRFYNFKTILMLIVMISSFSFPQWRELDNHYSTDFTSIYSNRPASYISVGANKIYRYKYEQEYWKIEEIFDTSVVLSKVYFTDSENGYAAGTNNSDGNAVISRTTNGGYTWSELTVIYNDFELNDLLFVDELHGWAAGKNLLNNTPLLAFTVNGGATWTGINFSSSLSSKFTSLYFTDNNTGWVSGYNTVNGSSILFRTNDDGNSWIPLVININDMINDIEFVDEHTGFLITRSGQIYKSADAGENWDLNYTASGSLNAIRFFNAKQGFAAGNDGLILKTSDGGNSWINELSGTSRDLLAISPDIKNTLTICGENGKVIVRELFSEKCELIPVSSSTVAGDYDNDGDLDIALTGFSGISGYNDKTYTDIFKNDGNGTFTSIQAKMIDVIDGSLDFGDYDNDGDIDMLVSGLNLTDSSYTTVAKVYKNQGYDFFEDSEINLNGYDRGFIEWGDLDNDGDLDIITSVGLYRNDGDDKFTVMNTVITGKHFAAGKIVDLDGDGDLDIFAGIENGSPEIFINNGDFYFNEILLPARNTNKNSIQEIESTLNQDNMPMSSATYFGTSETGDYDNDGDQDLLWMSSTETILFRNEGNLNFVIPSSIDLPVLRTGSGKFGDFDNDGDLDLFLTGGNSYNNWKSGLYINEGNDLFTQYPFYFSGDDIMSYASLDCGDIDNDGDLDLIIVGEMPIDRWVTRIYYNNIIESNTKPEAPASLNSQRNNFDLTLDWSESFDLQTENSGLTYNVAIGTTPGGIEIVSPMSDMTSGYRQISSTGNAGNNNNFHLKNLKSGKYYWSVQAIDNNFAGSVFSVIDSFRVPSVITGITIGPGNINPVTIDSTLITIQFNDPLNNNIGLSVDRYDVLPGGLLPNNLENPAPISWLINLTEGNLQGSFDLIFDLSEFELFSDYSRVHLLYRSIEDEEWLDLGTPSDLSGGIAAIRWNGLSSFGEFTVCGGLDVPLPVELLSFNASLDNLNNEITLSWKTATELNNYGFEIERSENNSSWEKIGFVSGAGSSTEQKEYNYLDRLGKKASNLKYRLKQIDFDGTSTYYEAIEIGFTPAEFVLKQNYPNPFNPATSINFELPVNAEVNLTVYDILGNEVTTLVDEYREGGFYKEEFNSTSGQLASGVYIYRLTAKTGTINFTQTMKMVLMK